MDDKFDEFWDEAYKADFGDCEPYKGIAEYAYEMGFNEGSLADGDAAAKCEELERDNRRLSSLVEKMRNCGNCKHRSVQSVADILGDESGEPCCRCDSYDKWEVY